MWPYVIALGLSALILKVFSDSEDEKETVTSAPKRKRIFISFPIENEVYRDYLVSQARKERSPFDFVDMSVKKPWKENEWEKRCRSKIKSCDGMIVLLSKNTWHSRGSRLEIRFANEEGIPIVGMHIKKNDNGAVPPELKGKQIITWFWENLQKILK